MMLLMLSYFQTEPWSPMQRFVVTVCAGGLGALLAILADRIKRGRYDQR
jgi:hypothetical protein